jgi:hypothetical protein
MREGLRTRPEDNERDFTSRDWLIAVLSLGAVLVGAVSVLAAAYLLVGR